MAFLNKIGSILKQGVGKNTSLELSASNASLFQIIRSMSSSKLFVGGLSYGTDESSLKEAFAQYGEVIEARIILDRDTGRSRGFGFISFPSSEEATSAMQSMDGQDLHGRRIRVNYATEKRRDGFGGGYGGGGFNYGGEGGNFAGGGGYAAGNYGGGGGYNSPGGGGGFSGGYNSAVGGGYGSSSGYNYGGEGGNVAGAGGYPTNNYGGGGGGFSSGNSAAGGYGSYGGGGSNYGNNNSSSSPIEGGNYGSTPNDNYSGQGSSFSGGYGGGNSENDFVGASSNNNGFANAGFGVSSETSYNGSQEQLSADQGTQPINEDFGKETLEGNYRDDDDEPKDYANTRG